eukprot:16303510-Heterocapsa_arctica.AAC.1
MTLRNEASRKRPPRSTATFDLAVEVLSTRRTTTRRGSCKPLKGWRHTSRNRRRPEQLDIKFFSPGSSSSTTRRRTTPRTFPP